MSILEKLSRDRVCGFLHASGTEILNGRGEPVLLCGWGLGNWLLCEGYMWRAGRRADRPRRIEAVVRELAGSAYAETFWKKFRKNYIRREDILRMAELGYNSVRVPINWRVLMEDEPGVAFLEDGFKLLDDLLDWCEEAKVYAFLDLHGAPGGQTGSNIDDCIDDFPRLFTDADSYAKGVALWEELARRYADRWIVGGYDLLNEPLRPDDHFPSGKPCEYLLPKLKQFYEDCIAVIRKHDTRHLLSIEGHHWSTDTAVFCKDYDPNMVIHFHRYAVLPDVEHSYREWLELSEKWQKPLWLGETGENTPEWFAAMYPLALRLGIGVNVWPWKKMACENSPYSVKMPHNWEKFIAYTNEGERPSYAEAQAMFDEYLENMLLENCEERPRVTNSVLCRPGMSLCAVDFDEGTALGYSETDALCGYRRGSGMRIVEPAEPAKKRFGFDCGWDALRLELREGESAEYTFYGAEDGTLLAVTYDESSAGTFEITQDGESLNAAATETTACVELHAAAETTIRVKCLSGSVTLNRIIYGNA